MTLTRRLFGGRTEARNSETLADMLAELRGGPVASGVSVTPASSLALTAVYSSVRLIADAVAGMPRQAFRRGDQSRTPIDPKPAILADPYPGMSPYDWAFEMLSSALLTGNAFGAKGGVSQRTGLPTMIMPLHPDRVTYKTESGRTQWRIDNEPVSPDVLFHVRGFSVPGMPVGLSPIGQARQMIGTGIAAEKFGARWFGDSANPSAVLESAENVGEEEALESMVRWEASHGGRRRPALLSGGLKYRQISISPEESQFLETQRFNVGQVARLFGVPPHMIGDVERSTSWGSGIEQQAIGFVTYTLGPWIRRFEEALSPLLPGQQYVKFNVDSLLRADSSTRWDNYLKARQIGAINVNEIRAREDLAPIGPDGDEYVQPLNWGPLGSVPQGWDPDGGDDA